MRKQFLLSFLAAATLLGGAAGAAPSRHDPGAILAKAIAGRTAGKPVDCLQLNQINSSRIIDRTAILYETSGGMLYVNKPASGAAFLRDGMTLVTDTHSPQLCSIDTVRLIDMGSRMPAGSVGLGKFVPYPKPGHSTKG